MARIRTVKPEFFKDDELAELGPYAMLLFEGLWCYADREGRLEDRPKRIKADVLPYFDVDADQVLAALHAAGFIVRYTAGEDRCIWIPKFKDHQRITGKEAETESRIPAYEGEKQQGNTGETPETTGKERKGKEREGEDSPPPSEEKESRFRKPSIDEVQAYMATRSFRDPKTMALRFWNYYESNGWMVGKKPMKNWQASVRTWELTAEPKDKVQAKAPAYVPAEDIAR